MFAPQLDVCVTVFMKLPTGKRCRGQRPGDHEGHTPCIFYLIFISSAKKRARAPGGMDQIFRECNLPLIHLFVQAKLPTLRLYDRLRGSQVRQSLSCAVSNSEQTDVAVGSYSGMHCITTIPVIS